MKFNRNLFAFLLVAQSCLLFAHNGSINGQIVEKTTGLELPGVIVRLTPANTTATTNMLGFFSFSSLPAGDYSLTISYLGFESKKIELITVRHSETTTLKIELEEAVVNLNDVEISTALAKPFQGISALDIKTRPISSTQEVLRIVPGLFIAQHAGGGKAEQIFLRGFDIDHGTDINLTVDGMPVNMVSHAHGQGYADLHFVIPELINDVTFKKGPYYADAGNFTTAGLVRFRTADALDQNMLKLEAGQYNTSRVMGAFNLLGRNAARKNQHAYLAGEAFLSDGYFEQPQQFSRFNLFGKYNALLDDDQRVNVSASAFQSNWDASGQIPERAVKSGLISRFGAIDNTEGGKTSRYNFNFEHLKSLGNNALLKNQFYFSRYDFELYSNFTFFNNDPVNGDQIRQKESRRIIGYQGTHSNNITFLARKLETELGLYFRNDATKDSELSHVYQREVLLDPLALGNVNETNLGAFAAGTLVLSPRFSVNAGLRYDFFKVAYLNKLDTLYNNAHANAGILSPKLNLFFDPNQKLRFYLSSGYGFHSNDARVVVPQNGLDILPKALGTDLGIIVKPNPALLFNVAAWYLALEQEFVYVGDAAIVEAGGKTERYGLDFSARVQLHRSLFADADLTYSYARSVADPEGENLIPLAPKFTATGGINWDKGKGLYSSLRVRHLGDRPANEDGSLSAEGYFLLDAVLGWKQKRFELECSVQNLANTNWKEAQFETESRLPFENEPVTEIHFTPGTPFFIKGGVTFRF